jgi:pimeloyl-ACP methyl ester carboxylesterase
VGSYRLGLPAVLTALLLSIQGLAPIKAWAGAYWPMEGFVDANGVRLEYLDWGGSGPALILLHGLADDPHRFDDLAPAFTGRFHVIAYARRGSGNSDAKGPYDIVTLTRDLLGLMDALGIEKANLVGHSAGGDEITEMAAEHPERVSRLIYLDSAYDWGEPDFRAAYDALPSKILELPASAMASLDAFRSYQKMMWYRELDDMTRIEADLRERVVIQPGGSLKDRAPREVVDALYSALWTNKLRDYKRVRCPALAIYAEHLYDLHVADIKHRDILVTYEQMYWGPFQRESIERVRRELANVEIARVRGLHDSFFLTDRQEVVKLMRRFLSQSPKPARIRADD